MSLLEKINQDIKQAMLAREKDKLESLRAIKAAIMVAQTEKGASGEMNAETEIKLLQRLVKQRRDAAEVYQSQGRADLAEPELLQLSFIEAYLPEQMSAADIEKIIAQLIAETGAQGIKDMGKVMGQASRQLAGKADNKVVAEIIKKLLS